MNFASALEPELKGFVAAVISIAAVTLGFWFYFFPDQLVLRRHTDHSVVPSRRYFFRRELQHLTPAQAVSAMQAGSVCRRCNELLTASASRLPCGHIVHDDCAREWAVFHQTNNQCPECNLLLFDHSDIIRACKITVTLYFLQVATSLTIIAFSLARGARPGLIFAGIVVYLCGFWGLAQAGIWTRLHNRNWWSDWLEAYANVLNNFQPLGSLPMIAIPAFPLVMLWWRAL